MRTAASRPALPILTFALALAMCGCAELHWQKADGSDASVAQDLEACRKEAQAKFGSASAFGMTAGLNDPRFGPTGPSQADLRMQESQAASTCMRQRGYVLVPDKK